MRSVEFPEFAWGCGEEGSDPLVLHEGREIRVDEFALSGHFEQRDSDLAAVASLGIDVWRYGTPWRLCERAPGDYDWTLWDEALAACGRHGLRPVVDLCHFGLPDHYAGFCDARWVDGFLRYVEAFLARYAEPVWFTPINEPFVTAFCSALVGTWNDRRTSMEDFAVALSHCLLADLEALARIRADRDGWLVGAEGVVCPVFDPDDAEATEWAAGIESLPRAAWDLRFGRPLHSSVEPAFARVDDDVRGRLETLATTEHTIAGHDFYPTGAWPYKRKRDELSIGERIDAYERWARAWLERYAVPFWVAETSNLGLPVTGQSAWLRSMAELAGRLRDDGLPCRGMCWYSRGDQYDWESGLAEPVGRVTEVGLFDAERRRRPVADTFAMLVRAGPPS